eukprot:6899388-Prymnesium_polylepis.1
MTPVQASTCLPSKSSCIENKTKSCHAQPGSLTGAPRAAWTAACARAGNPVSSDASTISATAGSSNADAGLWRTGKTLAPSCDWACAHAQSHE